MQLPDESTTEGLALEGGSPRQLGEQPAVSEGRDRDRDEDRRVARLSRVARSPATASVLALLAVLAIWWVASLVEHDAFVIPSPPQVFHRFVSLVRTPGQLDLLSNIWASLVRVLVGWGAGSLMGIAVGVAMASRTWVRGALEPLIEMIRPMPALALIPLLIIWFGLGELPKYAIIWFTTFPVVTISTVSAIRGIDRTWIQSAQTLGASRSYIVRRVVVPGAMPGILTGIRLASGIAWGTLVAAEIIGSTQGIGWLILQAQQFLDTEAVFVGIIVIGALALLMDRLLRLAEHFLIPWQGMR
jgi:taurine transport system permease protein